MNKATTKMGKKIGLGKGLESLLGSDSNTKNQATTRQLPLSQLTAGKFQPRRAFDQDELETLAESIKQHGVIQAILVRPIKANKYEIIAGERRFRAAKIAGLTKIQAEVRELSDEKAQIYAMVENLQRADLNPMEQAKGLASMIDLLKITHQQAADAVGKSRVAVTNQLRLLTLHKDVQTKVEAGVLEMGQARALLGLDTAKQSLAAQIVIARQLNTRETEAYVKRLLKGETADSDTNTSNKADQDTVNLMNNLSKYLSMRVEITAKKNGSGKLTVHYGSLDSLEKVIKQLKK